MKLAILFLASVLVVACADDEPTPPEQCQALLDTICNRVVECEPNPPTHSVCIEVQETVIDCGAVVAINANYGRCVDAINGQSCEAWNATTALPASCNDVLGVE